MINFIIGLAIGAFVGILLIALVSANKEHSNTPTPPNGTKYKYCIYGNSLCSERKYFNSIDEIFEDIVNASFRLVYDKKDLHIDYYCKDKYGKVIYMITTDKIRNEDNIKKYGCPQFVRYMVEI